MRFGKHYRNIKPLFRWLACLWVGMAVSGFEGDCHGMPDSGDEPIVSMNSIGSFDTLEMVLSRDPVLYIDAGREKKEAPAIPIIFTTDTHNVQLFPKENFYPRYQADPRYPQSSARFIYYDHSAIHSGGGRRFNLQTGGHCEILGVTRKETPAQGFQIGIDGSLSAQFNLDSHLDNIGWDGFYHLAMTWKYCPEWAFKLAIQHDSSHIGDEYIENTGRERTEYTREEVAFGVSCFPSDNLRVYSEIGRAYKYHHFQKPLRAQFGCELTGDLDYLQQTTGWYAATDVTVWEENEGKTCTCLQMGMRIKPEDDWRQYRVGIELYNGRSQIGEFYKYQERYIALGFWVDI